MQKYYGIGYSVASLIFLSNAAGFIVAAFFSQALYARVGRAWTIVCGSTSLAIGALIMGLGLHFGTVVMSFFLGGAGMAIVRCAFLVIIELC
jgi:fucose permease